MIPLSMLRQLTRLYSRLVMATTSGGYEGTGRGFMLRFVADLQRFKLLHFRLEKPVRWCQGDRLEAWLSHCLMLKPESEPLVAADIPVNDCRLEILEQPGSTAAPVNAAPDASSRSMIKERGRKDFMASWRSLGR